jgi:release factor glutamine methyltransferase
MSNGSSTLNDLKADAIDRLTEADVDSPRLAAEVILAHALSLTRSALLARSDVGLNPDQLSRFQIDLDRLIKGEPLAYVVGHREFYDLDLITDERALIPRPETECLIEKALKLFEAHPHPIIVDIGTGSGAIAVTLAKHLPSALIIATDLSPDAIDLARSNARRHDVEARIDFRVGSLLQPINEQVDLIATNLPYIDDKDWPFLARTIRGHEPRMAFLGGPDGLALIREFLKDAPRCLKPHGLILMEIGAYHGDEVSSIAKQYFPQAKISIEPDYAGLDRLAVIQLL